MPWSLSKYNPGTDVDLFCGWSGGFTDDEIEQIRWMGNVGKFQSGTTGRSTVADENVRKSSVMWIQGNKDTRWLFERLSNITSRVNHERFLYDIDEMSDLQYTRYGDDGDHYTWHFDATTDRLEYRIRKISMVMGLNDPDEYEGGDFQIIKTGNIEKIETLRPAKGEIIFFSSMFPHRVTPVTKGTRETLVAWISGVREGQHRYT